MKILSITEFARRASLDRKTVYHHIRQGHLKTKEYTVTLIGIPATEISKLPRILKKKSYPHPSS